MVTLAVREDKRRNAAACAGCTIVARMSRAGAILVGALNMEELAYGFLTENHHYGTTRNPHDRTRGAAVRREARRRRSVPEILPITLGPTRAVDSRAGIAVRCLWLKPPMDELPRSGTYPS